MEEKKDIKMLIVGSKMSGKTNLMMRYVKNEFSHNFMGTIGIDMKKVK